MNDKNSKNNLKFIQQYVNTSHVVILSILSILSSFMLIAVAFMSKIVIDAVESGNKNNIIINVSIAIILLILYALTFGIAKYLSTKFSMISTKRIVSDSHYHLLKSNYKAFNKSHSVEQLKIVANDAETAVSTYIGLYPTIASMVIKLVAGIDLMLYINYKITLIAIAIGVVLCAFMVIFKKPMKIMYKKVQEKVAKSNAYMQESLKNIEVVKALDMADYVKEGVLNRLENVRVSIEKRAKYFNIVNALIYFLLEISFLFILVYGGSLIVIGELALSSFVVLISVIEIVKTPFMSITNISNSIYNMMGSTERVKTLLNTKEDEYVNSDFDKIIFKDVSYTYDNKEILKDFNVEINKKDKIAIVGYSGAGKSTFIKLLLGIESPSSGNIYIEKDNNKENVNGKLLNVGYVPQNIELFNDTIKNNLTIGKDIIEDKILEALKFVDLYDEVIEKGLDYELKENGKGLSIGQLQRLAIARAVLSDKDILVLDEPFSALDKKTALDIFNKLENLDKTIIIVSHDDFVKDKAQKLVMLGDNSCEL